MLIPPNQTMTSNLLSGWGSHFCAEPYLPLLIYVRWFYGGPGVYFDQWLPHLRRFSVKRELWRVGFHGDGAWSVTSVVTSNASRPMAEAGKEWYRNYAIKENTFSIFFFKKKKFFLNSLCSEIKVVQGNYSFIRFDTAEAINYIRINRKILFVEEA